MKADTSIAINMWKTLKLEKIKPCYFSLKKILKLFTDEQNSG